MAWQLTIDALDQPQGRSVTDDRLRLDDQLCFAAYSASNAIIRSYRPRLQQLGLTYPQFLVMLVLWQDGSATIGQIAARLELASHAVTPLINRLQAGGYLSRHADARDRRVVHIRLTEAGADLEAAAGAARGAVVRDLDLDEADLVGLRQGLRVVVDRLSGAARRHAARPERLGQPKKTSASA